MTSGNKLSGTAWLVALVLLSIQCGARADKSQQETSLTLVLLGQALIEHDPRQYVDAPLQSVLPILEAGDVVFTNLEVSICSKEPTCAPTRTDQYFHGTTPEVLDYLASIGINLMSLANNHSWDYGADGIIQTIQETQRRGIVHAGTGRTIKEAVAPSYLEVGDRRIGLVATASANLQANAPASADRTGVNVMLQGDDAAWQRNLDAIRAAADDASWVIAYQHFQSLGTVDWQEAFARAAIDAGADVYVSHGEPVLSGVERYRNGLIFYGLGNFIFHTRSEPGHYPAAVWQSVIARVTLSDDGPEDVEFIPIVIDEGRPGPGFLRERGYPTLAEGEVAATILKSLADVSKAYGTKIVTVDGRGYLRRPD